MRLYIILLLCAAAGAQSPADAINLDQAGKFREAIDAWQAITKANPKDAAAFAALGVDLAREQRYREAAAAYRKALALNPRLTSIQLNLGLAEFKQGRFEQAIPP
jgi:Flp pilus assembly protein TadD